MPKDTQRIPHVHPTTTMAAQTFRFLANYCANTADRQKAHLANYSRSILWNMVISFIAIATTLWTDPSRSVGQIITIITVIGICFPYLRPTCFQLEALGPCPSIAKIYHHLEPELCCQVRGLFCKMGGIWENCNMGLLWHVNVAIELFSNHRVNTV